MVGVIPQHFPFPHYEDITRAAVINTCIKIKQYFSTHDSIQISVSGGADSDCIVHLICKYFPEYLHKCHFAFVNTGLEYDATKRHLSYLEERYRIQIDRIRGKSVVYACKNYGFPILSKFKSHFIDLYLRDLPSGYKYIFGDGVKSYHSMQFTENQKKLVLYLKENNIKVSAKCCDISKKKPLSEYVKKHKCDLVCTGERKAEDGVRAMKHSSCFEPNNKSAHADKFMPLFWWTDYERLDFKQKEGIVWSDCYEVYGMKRTGCCGCPFNQNVKHDLEIMAVHEPKLLRACLSVFGKSYELMDAFNCRRRKCMPDEIQLMLPYDDSDE